jgi:hypothetical protein
MSIAALKFVSDTLDSLGINYQFGEWSTNPVPNPYFVGEYTEPESLTRGEDGFQETSFILTGTGTNWLKLEEAKATIENNVSKTAILSNGNGIAVFYAGSLTVPTGDAKLKRIQINLTIKEWSVN